MTENEPKRSWKGEAEYWETHTIDEVEGEELQEEVVVRKQLSSVFSIRLNPEDVKQLREMADAQGVGPTTMARRLLRQCLSDRSSRLVQIVLGADSPDTLPQGGELGELVFFSKAQLDDLHRVFDSLVEQSITISPGQGNLEEQLKQLRES